MNISCPKFAPWFIPDMTMSILFSDKDSIPNIAQSAGVASTEKACTPFTKGCTSVTWMGLFIDIPAPTPLCSLSGATTMTSPKSFTASTASHNPLACIPSSFVTKIRINVLHHLFQFRLFYNYVIY